MKRIYELKNLAFSIRRDRVFKSLDCREGQPGYEEFLETWEENYEKICGLARQAGILGFGTLSEALASKAYPAGSPVLYAVTTIGGAISKESTRAFEEGDYVKGMLCDAMADEALFSMETGLMEQVRAICREHNMGVAARLEAPCQIPMEAQKAAWETLELEMRLGIKISSGWMFDPVKTCCQVFLLTEDPKVFEALHDCRKCPNQTCKRRSIPDTKVTVCRGMEKQQIFVHAGESLLEALIRNGFYVSAVCAGRGSCGNCRVRILQGETLATAEDRRVFCEKELEEGWRLACRIYPAQPLEVSLEQREEDAFEILTVYEQDPERRQKGSDAKGNPLRKPEAEETEYEIAIDIGTTTIALELLGKKSGTVFKTAAVINGQRRYGADVISRIQASVNGKKEELQKSVQKDLQKGIEELLSEHGADAKQILRIAISANTTMVHLLMGYDCSTLGSYPFTPVTVDVIRGSAKELLGIPNMEAEVILLPGISAYVGGDIVAGMYACGFGEKEEISLLVDLGTNGEMALGNRERILVTSAAAGPAFEGGNILWGTGSIPGAIASVRLQGREAKIETIGKKDPCGICGTGVIETVAELVREGLLEDSGLLEEDYFEEGFLLAQTSEGKKIVLTQKDVREIQLAKAAVRAGIETLLLRYGIEKEEISYVYIAGGFGYRLDLKKAVAIGMLPKELEHCSEAMGNTALAGAAGYLRENEGEAHLKELIHISREIGLSADKDFNELYLDAMFFEA